MFDHFKDDVRSWLSIALVIKNDLSIILLEFQKHQQLPCYLFFCRNDDVILIFFFLCSSAKRLAKCEKPQKF